MTPPSRGLILSAPRPDEIAWAAQVAPVWTAIKAGVGLHGELQRFAQAAEQRLPPHRADRPEEVLSGPVAVVRTYAGTVCSADSLCGQHPGLQAYVAAEPERQARAAREAEERQRQAAHEALAPARKRVLEERMRVWWRTNHPYAKLSDYGFDALRTKAEADLRAEIAKIPAAELQQAVARLEQADRIAAARKPAPRPGPSPHPF